MRWARRTSLTWLLAALVGCQGAAPSVAPRAKAGGRVTKPEAIATGLGGTGASVISNGGGGVIANNGGGVISNNGATLVGTLRAPATLLSDRGGGLISDQGSGLVGPAGAFRLSQADAVAQYYLPNVRVELRDATGAPLRDGAGNPVIAQTDASGTFRFDVALPDVNLLVTAPLAGGLGAIQAVATRDARDKPLQADLFSSLTTAYIMGKFVATQAERQQTLDRLPGEVAEETRRAAVVAFSQTGSQPPTRLDDATALATTEALRQGATAFDQQMEKVRRLLIAAGQADLGAGELASRARFSDVVAAARAADGTTWVLDGGSSRLWKVVEGRLTAVAGLGGVTRGVPAPATGKPAREVHLGEVVDLALDAQGRPLLLSPQRLDRVEADGTLVRVWQGDEGANALGVVVRPQGGLWVLQRHAVTPLEGAPALRLPSQPGGRSGGTTVDAVSLACSREGVAYMLTENRGAGARGWWRLSADQAPVALPMPASLGVHDPFSATYTRLLGLDAEGWLAASDNPGSLSFVSPGGETATVPAAVTGTWPEVMRPAAVELRDADGKSFMMDHPRLRIGGDATRGRWLQSPWAVGGLAADGALTLWAGDGNLSPSGSTRETPTGLQEPIGAVATAGGELLVLEDSSNQVLRVVERVASLHVGQPTSQWNQVRADKGGPEGAYTFEQPGVGVGGAVRIAFGLGYQAPAATAYMSQPALLRLAPDEALWVLDDHAFLRRVAGGQLTTLAVTRPGQGRVAEKAWVDVWPTSATDGVVLARRGTAYHLVTLAQVHASEALAVIPQPPMPTPPEAGDDPDAWDPGDYDAADPSTWRQLDWWPEGHPADGLAPLPGGAWLIRAYGRTYRWRPGGAPQLLQPSGPVPATAWASERQEGGRLAADADGRVVFATPRVVYRVEPETGAYTPLAGRGTALLAGDDPDTGLLDARSVAVTPAGELLIVDVGARQVKRLPPERWR
ncbi:MAG: hypothetical protein VKS61_13360 [Candidatus Sericytochromatia bacterium]|nr:hypothetical protein [Candidatus Sericytochromatia bacterium]